ncbi:protein ALP1-like [Aristolochia californica]|uniref:protein ALP1-like n=1 Tax=Aristolochia californica TaxID=171875 RepID=UPI0035D68D95
MDEPEDVNIVRDTSSPLLSMDESPGNQSKRSKRSSSTRRRKRTKMPDDDTSRFIDAMDRIAQTFENFMMKPKEKKPNIERDWVKALREIPDMSKKLKDCIGAIDGTHIKANIPLEDQPRLSNRKGQNVMATCSFDMQFTYVLVGWEGSAVDSRVLKDAFTRRDKIFVSEGKDYLVDVGYANLPGFLAPYRRTCTPPFSFKTQVKIVHACCILHNYICGEDYDDIFEDEDDDSGGELGGGGDVVQLGAMDDTDNDDCDGLEDVGSQVTCFQRQSALESTKAAQF